MMFVLYANALQLISISMFKSGGTKKKSDIEAALDTYKFVSCDVASNYKMKLLHFCPSSLTKAPIRFPREPWLAKMMFVGLDLVPWVEILIRKKDGTQKRIVYLFAHCFVQQSRVFEPSSVTFTEFCDIFQWMNPYSYNGALVKPSTLQNSVNDVNYYVINSWRYAWRHLILMTLYL